MSIVFFNGKNCGGDPHSVKELFIKIKDSKILTKGIN